MNRTALFVTLLISAHTGFTQPFSSHILHKMQKLRTAGTVLYIAAHPDDENTRLISYLCNERLFRTAYLSLTHGEGGQNLIGSEQGDALGAIRTQELLAARRIDGGEQYFSSAEDFGYSKKPEETLKKWNREKVLSEMVLLIRKLRPDVIICRFPSTGEGGHGHHTASAILALEAFDAAADRNRFTEQTKTYSPWKCRRVYWNTFNFSSGNTIGPGQFTLDVGGYNPLLGKSYGEIASEARSMHKSQGFGTLKQRGTSVENFKLLRGDSTGPDIFSGINSGLSRFEAFEKVDQQIEKCIEKFQPSAPHLSVPALVNIRRLLAEIKNAGTDAEHWKSVKLKEVDRLLLDCAGIWLEATTTLPHAASGETVAVKFSVLNRTETKAALQGIRLKGETLNGSVLETNKTFTAQSVVQLTGSKTGDDNNGYSVVAAPALHAIFKLDIEGELVEFDEQVVYKRSDPVKGEVIQPFYEVPRVSIAFTEPVYIPGPDGTKEVKVRLHAYSPLSAKLRIAATKGWEVLPFDSAVSFSGAGDVRVVDFRIRTSGSIRGMLTATVVTDKENYHSTVSFIQHDHIPTQLLTRDAAARLVNPGLKVNSVRVGYIEGAGDEVAACLRQAGYQVVPVSENQISTANLSQFDAVVTGIRAFNVNENLHQRMPALLDYVQSGGNLIVQYNTNSRVGPLKFTPGPYPFSITRQRVTDETAKVEFAERQHPVLNHPNKITSEDFDGWVQERGIYFAKDTDERYHKIFRMADPGEKPEDGSLIVAPWGKGNFVYTGLAFFRQLPAGVPGAYRLFSNLIELPDTEPDERKN